MPSTSSSTSTTTSSSTNYVKYIGIERNHAVGVTAPGNNPDNPLDGGTSAVVSAQPGSVVALEPAIAAAVLDAEPKLWQAVEGFGA